MVRQHGKSVIDSEEVTPGLVMASSLISLSISSMVCKLSQKTIGIDMEIIKKVPGFGIQFLIKDYAMSRLPTYHPSTDFYKYCGCHFVSGFISGLVFSPFYYRYNEIALGYKNRFLLSNHPSLHLTEFEHFRETFRKRPWNYVALYRAARKQHFANGFFNGTFFCLFYSLQEINPLNNRLSVDIPSFVSACAMGAIAHHVTEILLLHIEPGAKNFFHPYSWLFSGSGDLNNIFSKVPRGRSYLWGLILGLFETTRHVISPPKKYDSELYETLGI